MTVQELFTYADIEEILYAYLLIDEDFQSNPYKNELKKRIESACKLKNIIKANVELFKKCIPIYKEHRTTLFITEIPVQAYSRRGEYELDGFVVLDNEYFDAEKMEDVERYCFDMMSVEELAACKVAEESLHQLGLPICAAFILNELFFYGFNDTDRTEYIKKIYKDIEIAEKEIENDESYPADEVFAEPDKMLISHMTEEEKQYHQAKTRFEDNVKHIEKRHRRKTQAEIKSIYSELINKEYKDRNSFDRVKEWLKPINGSISDYLKNLEYAIIIHSEIDSIFTYYLYKKIS